MATTPTFGWPTPDDTDLVRDGAAAIRALADAVDASGDAGALGGLVAVKHALKTDPEAFTNVAATGNVDVPGLSITHTVADASNKLIITAFFGAAANSQGRAVTGIGVAQDGTFIGIGDAAGSRTRVGAGGHFESSVATVYPPSVTFVHTPGAGEKTYTVRAININNSTRTLYVNRVEDDIDSGLRPRAASALVIQEVRV